MIFQYEEFVQIRTDFISGQVNSTLTTNAMEWTNNTLAPHNERNEISGNFSAIFFSIKHSLWRSSLQRLQSTGCTSSASLGHLCLNLERQKQNNSGCGMELSAFPWKNGKPNRRDFFPNYHNNNACSCSNHHHFVLVLLLLVLKEHVSIILVQLTHIQNQPATFWFISVTV